MYDIVPVHPIRARLSVVPIGQIIQITLHWFDHVNILQIIPDSPVVIFCQEHRIQEIMMVFLYQIELQNILLQVAQARFLIGHCQKNLFTDWLGV